MDFNTFKCIVEKAKVECPLLFELDHDEIPQMEDIVAFQKQHHLQLPKKYIQFLSNYGGGYFGYANIYSFDKNSYFYLCNHNENKPASFLYVADNECGDYYAFPVENGKCQDRVVLLNHENSQVCSTEFSDILEYLVKVGLKKQISFGDMQES